MVSIIAISDLHGNLPDDLPSCDLLLIAGDICPSGSSSSQALWLDTTFRHWLEQSKATHVVGVAGNHDKIFEAKPHLVPSSLKWHYLQDQSIELFGLKIYGTPWQLPFYGAFNMNDKMLVSRYSTIPKSTDIVVSHGPPFGICDEVQSYLDTPYHTGSLALRNKLLEIQPQLVVFGHIHEGYGNLRAQ